jgi:hypothetical protein
LKLAMASGVCPPAELGFGAEYYSVVNGVCSRAGSYFGGRPVLTQAVGYAVVLGFGAFFALFTSFLVSLRSFGLSSLEIDRSQRYD